MSRRRDGTGPRLEKQTSPLTYAMEEESPYAVEEERFPVSSSIGGKLSCFLLHSNVEEEHFPAMEEESFPPPYHLSEVMLV